MRVIIGLLVGVAMGIIGLSLIYIGIWECLVMGIVDIINQCKAPVTDAVVIAWAIVRVLFCELPIVIGIWVCVLGLGVSVAIMESGGSR